MPNTVKGVCVCVSGNVLRVFVVLYGDGMCMLNACVVLERTFIRTEAVFTAKFPDAAVHPWLEFTTGTRSKKINGAYLFRNFQEGLRVFHRDLNVVWAAVLKEGISGKGKKEVWTRFCYLY